MTPTMTVEKSQRELRKEATRHETCARLNLFLVKLYKDLLPGAKQISLYNVAKNDTYRLSASIVASMIDLDIVKACGTRRDMTYVWRHKDKPDYTLAERVYDHMIKKDAIQKANRLESAKFEQQTSKRTLRPIVSVLLSVPGTVLKFISSIHAACTEGGGQVCNMQKIHELLGEASPDTDYDTKKNIFDKLVELGCVKYGEGVLDTTQVQWNDAPPSLSMAETVIQFINEMEKKKENKVGKNTTQALESIRKVYELALKPTDVNPFKQVHISSNVKVVINKLGSILYDKPSRKWHTVLLPGETMDTLVTRTHQAAREYWMQWADKDKKKVVIPKVVTTEPAKRVYEGNRQQAMKKLFERYMTPTEVSPWKEFKDANVRTMINSIGALKKGPDGMWKTDLLGMNSVDELSEYTYRELQKMYKSTNNNTSLHPTDPLSAKLKELLERTFAISLSNHAGCVELAKKCGLNEQAIFKQFSGQVKPNETLIGIRAKSLTAMSAAMGYKNWNELRDKLEVSTELLIAPNFKSSPANPSSNSSSKKPMEFDQAFKEMNEIMNVKKIILEKTLEYRNRMVDFRGSGLPIEDNLLESITQILK